MNHEETFRAAAIAHAIRLGKKPTPGMVMSCTAQVKEIEEAELAAADYANATAKSEAVKLEFTVTPADIAGAIRLINEQRAVYREPKTTLVKLRAD